MMRTTLVGWLLVVMVVGAGCSASNDGAPEESSSTVTSAGVSSSTTQVQSTSSTTTTSPTTTVPPTTTAATGSTTDAPAWTPKTVDELENMVVLINAGFGTKPDGSELAEGWYRQVWMNPNDDLSEEVSQIDGAGLHLEGSGGSTRAGIAKDVNMDVSGFDHVVVALNGLVESQSLAGTGFDGREAPLAMLVSYVDADGVEHRVLDTDPDRPDNMFFLGYSILDADGSSSMRNGVLVEKGVAQVVQFDLMGLDPRPVKILKVGIEGSGWAPRSAWVFEFVLAAGD
ncbi:MAG: hypothetical protein GWP04_07470 [Gammaproteobacteria bacterium]|nr:hypothetical protein [Gammaproteobacteria bacterium]